MTLVRKHDFYVALCGRKEKTALEFEGKFLQEENERKKDNFFECVDDNLFLAILSQTHTGEGFFYLSFLPFETTWNFAGGPNQPTSVLKGDDSKPNFMALHWWLWRCAAAAGLCYSYCFFGDRLALKMRPAIKAMKEMVVQDDYRWDPPTDGRMELTWMGTLWNSIHTMLKTVHLSFQFAWTFRSKIKTLHAKRNDLLFHKSVPSIWNYRGTVFSIVYVRCNSFPILLNTQYILIAQNLPCTVKSHKYESRNKAMSRKYNRIKDDAVMEVSIEKSHYTITMDLVLTEAYRNNEI